MICNKVTYSDNGVVVFSTDQEIQLPEGAEHEYSSIPAITDQLPEMLLSNEGLYLFIFVTIWRLQLKNENACVKSAVELEHRF